MSKDPWGAYARRQAMLSRVSHVDDQTWGLEACLNHLVDGADGFMAEADVDRVSRSASRRERYRGALRRQHLVVEGAEDSAKESPDSGHRWPTVKQSALSALSCVEDRFHSRHLLHALKKHVSGEDLALLQAIGEGREYDELSTGTKVRTGTLRVRVQRLRVMLSALFFPALRAAADNLG